MVLLGDDKKAWLTEDSLTHLAMGFFVVLVFLNSTSPAALGPLLMVLGGFSVFLMAVGVYRYFTQQDQFTVAAGFALAFLISLFFGPQHVINPLLLLLSLLARVI